MRRALAAALAAAALAPPASAATPAQITATVDRERIATALGRAFELRCTIRNDGPGPAGGLVAHLSVLSLRERPYVDPEDWSPRRVVFLAPLAAGASRTLTWRMTAVDAGTFGVYVSVLGTGSQPPVNTPAIRLRVTQRRTLDAGGILPLAIAVPALLGSAAVALRLRRRG